MKKRITIGVGAALLACGLPAFAHHGSAAYDSLKTVVLDGTVEKFEFVNPHILTNLAVTTKKGDVQHWVIEMEPPSLGKDTATVVAALSRQVRKLPASLWRSLTWDRGLEMAQHKGGLNESLQHYLEVYSEKPQKAEVSNQVGSGTGSSTHTP